MSYFKVGDKVRCIDAETSSGRLEKGKLYIVSTETRSDMDFSEPIVNVEGSDMDWFSNRFELVQDCIISECKINSAISIKGGVFYFDSENKVSLGLVKALISYLEGQPT